MVTLKSIKSTGGKMVRIDSITQEEETRFIKNKPYKFKKNVWYVEYDGWHFEGTIRQVINELLNYERRELKKELKG